MTGGNHVNETHDVAKVELERLAEPLPGALVTPVRKTISDHDISPFDLTKFDPGQVTTNSKGDHMVSLTVRQFEDYQQLAGHAIVETVRQEMQTPEWKSMTDEEKRLEVKDIQKDMKKAAKERLYGTPQ